MLIDTATIFLPFRGYKLTTELSSFTELKKADFLSYDSEFDNIVGRNPRLTLVAEESFAYNF
ncbi:hypothetical protein CONCODRAFT_3844 [Conidiobolus coronatus NRRL 28638]|uniref:Uncharacterized protein n=1 Tax=Conidiobolus coronatus (strain ATCC 28846 / CBS 209.66 / NRRL 28638) TaxID=796925 RepID=A0A137PDX3_CONC2|nr:hypothetical protein CONCODRAFT_3844 [Conidiobolus coronatus NRRL 28638]|eukprot:KXN73180.1 hypothetical protein CONCODRAFT_3844 [Conidiobolus coronatus NRRL 28638]